MHFDIQLQLQPQKNIEKKNNTWDDKLSIKKGIWWGF